MRRISLLSGSLTVAVLCGLVATCGDPQTRLPNGPSAPGIVGVEITGPDTIAPGQSAQYTAIVRMGDGTRKTAAADFQVVWRSSSSVLQVNATGLATARTTPGEAALSVEVSRRRATKEVVVVPGGTFRLVGRVIDAEFPSTAVTGARVEVMPGALAATADFSGRYRVYGVPSDAEVRITREGYMPFAQTIQLSGHATHDFRLTAAAPRIKLAGPHTLAIDVAGACSGLPSDLQHRRYDAQITQNELKLNVTLTEPRFKLDSSGNGNKFSGQAGPESATFALDWSSYYYYYYYPSVVEQLADGTFLIVAGTATMAGSADRLSGTFTGELTRVDSTFPRRFTSLGSCSNSSSIQFTLTPR